MLLALMQCEEHRTLSGLLHKIAGVGRRVDGLSHFFKHAPWQTERLVMHWWYHYRQVLGPLVAAEHAQQRALRPKRLGRPRKTIVTGFLILDDSTHEKPRGKKMEGLGQHYSSTAKKTVKWHSLFVTHYVLRRCRCPLEPRLYRQKAVCEREQMPFPIKVDRAEETIRTFEQVADTHTHVLIDRWYTYRWLWRAPLAATGRSPTA